MVLEAAGNVDNLVNHVLAFHDFAEDGVVPREPFGGGNGDKKLRAIGAGTGIGHGQLAFLVKAMRRALGFVLKFVAGAAHAGAAGVATLDHEVGDDAMKDGSVVERAGAAFAADGVLPAALALGQINEVLVGVGGFLFKQPPND